MVKDQFKAPAPTTPFLKSNQRCAETGSVTFPGRNPFYKGLILKVAAFVRQCRDTAPGFQADIGRVFAGRGPYAQGVELGKIEFYAVAGILMDQPHAPGFQVGQNQRVVGVEQLMVERLSLIHIWAAKRPPLTTRRLKRTPRLRPPTMRRLRKTARRPPNNPADF